MAYKLGKHVLSTLHLCDYSTLDSPKKLKEFAVESIKKEGGTILSIHGHKFEPVGATVFIMLAESHFSVHTWPEMGIAIIDVFTCSEKVSPEKIVSHFSNFLKCQVEDRKVEERVAIKKFCENSPDKGFIKK